MNINHLFAYDGFDDPVNHFCAGWVEMGGFTTPKRFRKGQTFQNRERLGLTGMRHGFHVTGRPAGLSERPSPRGLLRGLAHLEGHSQVPVVLHRPLGTSAS